MIATTRTVSLQGAVGHLIDVQVDVSPGQAATALVGRPDVAITEARDRCRAAVDNSEFTWPVTQRITVLLSPADVPKHGPHFDLAIAVGVIAAADHDFPRKALAGTAMVGELTLEGMVRCVPGVLPMAMAASGRGVTTLIVPEPQVAEAAMVPGLAVIGVRSLRQVIAVVAGWDEIPEAPPVQPLGAAPLLSWRGSQTHESVDFADVVGMADARYAVEIAAAGHHHVLLSGPKGSGKTTLAERVSGLLPDLSAEEALELTAVHSLAGALPLDGRALTRPPYRAPHHSASRAGILGGGTGHVSPGEVSKAHLGVLFLDEFPLFPADVVEALRETLESGEIRLSRGDEDAIFPARAMFVLAANPCPCGDFHPLRRDHSCTCTEVKRRHYRRKLTGPVMDRVDITRHVEPVRPHEYDDELAMPESTATMRARVSAARERQLARYADCDWRLNAHVPGPALRERWPLDGEGPARIRHEILTGRLTQRGGVRVHRLAWTVADLAGVERPGAAEVDVALRLRNGEPLSLASLVRRAG